MSKFQTLLLASLSLAMALILSCSNDNDEISKRLVHFERGAALIDSRDGRVYNTVEVSPYTWMADNLDYRAEGYRCYNDSLIYCEKHGALYNWEMAKSVCPAGWHLPSVEEWLNIAGYFGDEEEVVRAVLQAENGFSALLGHGSSGCENIRYHANDCIAMGFSISPCHCFNGNGWWSITNDGNDEAYRYYVGFTRGMGYGISSSHKSFFGHVRCVKNYN